MPKIPKSRSLAHVRSVLIYLATSLEVREKTSHLVAPVMSQITECDMHIARLNAAEDAHLRAMALLHAAVLDCQFCCSALWTQAGIHDRLNPGEDLEERLFPEGITAYTRRSGTGFADALPGIAAILDAALPAEPALEKLLHQLEEERDHVQLRLDLEHTALAERQAVYAEIEQAKEKIDEVLIRVEGELKSIFKRNKKLISSFFK